MKNKFSNTPALAIGAGIAAEHGLDKTNPIKRVARLSITGFRLQKKGRGSGAKRGALDCIPTPGTTSVHTSTAASTRDYATEERNDTRTTVRAALLAEIRACNDPSELARTIVPRCDEAARMEHDALLRGDLVSAISVRFKELNGRRLSRSEIVTLFSPPKNAPINPSLLQLSEFSVTARLKAAHGHELMYAADSNTWYLFANGCWRPEANAVRVIEKARSIVKSFRPTAELIGDDHIRAQTLRKLDTCERTAFARGVVAGLAGEAGIVTDSHGFDTDAELLGVPNGVVALSTGALLPPHPAARISLCAAFAYRPGVRAPWFERTVNEVFNGNTELIAFFQRIMGYTLLARPTERLIIIPLGGGKNGKSTVFNAIADTLGTYAGKMAAETIASPTKAPRNHSPGSPREDLLRLRGKRLVLSGEIRRGTAFNDDTIKELASGGDLITARGLFSKSSVEFRPTCVVVAPTNILPIVRDDDPAVWDRLLLLPFRQRFGDEGKPAIDLTRSAKLRTEGEGILAWLVEGALEYQREGLNVPAEVHLLKQQYKEDNSAISTFITEYCDVGPQYAAATRHLFAVWQHCALELGETHVAQTAIAFGRALSSQSHGFVQCLVQTAEGRQKGWRGIRLKDGVVRS